MRPHKRARGSPFEIAENVDGCPKVALSGLRECCNLSGSGPFLLQVFRQSGWLYQPDEVFEESGAAVDAAIKTFMYSGVDSVILVKNKPNHLKIRREFIDWRGKQYGKRLGWIEIFPK